MLSRTIRISMLACLMLLLTVWSPVSAQTSDPNIVEVPIGESGREYENAQRFRGIESDLIYLRPDADPEQYWDKSVPDRKKDYSVETRTEWPPERIILIVALLAVLIAIGAFAVRFAPGASINTSSPSEDRRRGAGGRRNSSEQSEAENDAVRGGEFIAKLQAMSDRRKAIVLLLKRCLDLALDANNMPLGQSQTAREILYRLPKTWGHIDALTRIVRIEERVQFGGADLPEATFQESIDLARPMLSQAMSAP